MAAQPAQPTKPRGIFWLLAVVALAATTIAGIYYWQPVVPPPPTVATRAPPETPKLPDLRTLEAVGFNDLVGWADDDHRAALGAFLRSCGRWQKAPDNRSLMMAGTVAEWRGVCADAENVALEDPDGARAFFEAGFAPFAVSNNHQPDGLFTAYFQIEIAGRRAAEGPLNVPLYARPADLVQVDLGDFRAEFAGRSIAGRIEDGQLRPYPPRGQIDQGALLGQNLELVWVDNPVDAFFLHIQGSGRVLLPDGAVVRVGYDGTNGHPYTTIGGLMIKRGILPKGKASMQGIRAWVEANPEAGAALMAENARYVFFRLLTGDEPIGAQGVPLTAGRSLAVDRKFMPLGVPLWLDTTAPGGDGDLPGSFRRLMVAQDTGSAITGPVRGDIYWGTGPRAGAVAGRMKYPGRYFVLLPHLVAQRLNGRNTLTGSPVLSSRAAQ